MQTSIFIARLLGPIMLLVGATILIDPQPFRTMVNEVIGSMTFVYLFGLLDFIAELAFVLGHNVSVADWRLLITLLGWLLILRGLARMVLIEQVMGFGLDWSATNRSYRSLPASLGSSAWCTAIAGISPNDCAHAQLSQGARNEQATVRIRSRDAEGHDRPDPGSRKIFAVPEAAPDLRVPLREIALDACSGEPPLPVYDRPAPTPTMMPPSTSRTGLKRTRIEWVKERGGVEEYEGRPIKPVDNGNVTGKHLARNFANTPKPLRAISPSPLVGEGGVGVGRGSPRRRLRVTSRPPPLTRPHKGEGDTPSPSSNGRAKASSPRR